MVRRFSRFRRPPLRPVPGRPQRGWRRLADPRFYLRAAAVLGVGGLVVLPLLADGAGALIGARGAEGCRVLRVIDGDTLTLHCPGRGTETLRLQGFDAPELFSPACATEAVAALQAKWALRAMLLRAGTLSVRRGGLDRYGRRLAILTLDGAPLAERMIAAGHARAYAGGQRGGWCG